MCCGELFRPDPRNVGRQQYCTEAVCRKASKKASQARWLANNPDYFKGDAHVTRVRRWRAANPGYAQGRVRKPLALQDPLSAQVIDLNQESGDFRDKTPGETLQDLLSDQTPVLIGFIAHLIDSTLQDSIVESVRHLQSLGADILATGGSHDRQTSASPRAPPASPSPV